MKFSVKRKKVKKQIEDAKVFLKALSSLNADFSFSNDEKNIYIIHSDIEKQDLLKLNLPSDAIFEESIEESYDHGFISIYYHANIYTVYAKKDYK